jgi:hypothetical protein
MGLSKSTPPKLLKVEVSEKNTRLRLMLVILLVALGVGLIAYAFHAMITKEPGWYTVELTNQATELNDEFIFNYRIGDAEVSAADEYKAVSAYYATEINRIHRLLDVYREHEGVVNLYTLNRRPGEILEVDEALYKVFARMEAAGSRILYMAPVFSEYRQLFSSSNEVEASRVDPYTDEETRLYLEKVMTYVSDPDMVRLELLGENRVKLVADESYLAFLRDNGVTDLIDLGWLTNAFVVDHVADAMIAKGFTAGNITSYDGYTRNFDASGETYGFNIFARVGQEVIPAAVAKYRGNISMVFLRNYPMSTQDMTAFYAYSDGHYAHRYANPVTGKYESALSNLVSYAYNTGCAEVALQMAEVFIAETFDEGRLYPMAEAGIYSIWCRDGTVYYNDESMTLQDLYTDDTSSYKSEYRNN